MSIDKDQDFGIDDLDQITYKYSLRRIRNVEEVILGVVLAESINEQIVTNTRG